jgi:hypothetical protein
MDSSYSIYAMLLTSWIVNFPDWNWGYENVFNLDVPQKQTAETPIGLTSTNATSVMYLSRFDAGLHHEALQQIETASTSFTHPIPILFSLVQ